MPELGEPPPRLVEAKKLRHDAVQRTQRSCIGDLPAELRQPQRAHARESEESRRRSAQPCHLILKSVVASIKNR
jgi:hypothetical protein